MHVCLESGQHQEYYGFSENEHITIKAIWLPLFEQKRQKEQSVGYQHSQSLKF